MQARKTGLNMKRQPLSLISQQFNQGFTLVELLLAAALGVVVVSAAGSALVNILTASQIDSSKNEANLDDNRTLSFIANEGKFSQKIIQNISGIGNQAQKCNLDNSLNPEAVVALQMPDDVIPDDSTPPSPLTVNDQYIVYCLADKNESVWLGNKVVYRWGPQLGSDGNYITPEDLSTWKTAVVVDLVDENASPSSPCPNTTDWQKIGSYGFYTCVNKDEAFAQIYLNLQVPDTDQPYKGQTKVFALASAADGN